MYIKRYAIAALIFVVLVGWYVYAFITQDSMSINIFGLELPSLSVALLVTLPMLFLIIGTILHVSFYSFLKSLEQRKYEKDFQKLRDAIVDAYFGKENRDTHYKTKRYELIGSLLENAKISPTFSATNSIADEKVAKTLDLIEKIKNGEVVDLKKMALSTSNPLVIQNERNRYKQEKISAEDILSHQSKYDTSLCREVYIDFAQTAPWYAIEKYKEFMSKEALFEILKRINAQEDTLELSNEVLLNVFALLVLKKDDYLAIAQTLSMQMLPEQRIKLFETLSEQNEEAISAYLFTLFDLEMLAPADEILENSQADEYLKFKSYRALKECNKHFNIKLFV